MDSLGGEVVRTQIIRNGVDVMTTFIPLSQAFTDVQGEGFIPACTLGVGQKAKLVFGHDVNALKFFTLCGLQEGYEPFCV